MSMNNRFRNTVYQNRSLERIPTPEKIKCSRCLKVKGNQAFSQKQINELKQIFLEVEGKHERALNPTVAQLIPCSQCSGAQVVELTCYMCDVTKGLNRFSKAQRRTPDKATCFACMEVRLNTEPAGSDSDGSDDSDDDDSDSTDSIDDAASTLPGTFSGLSVGSAYRTSQAPSSAASMGGVPVTNSNPSTPAGTPSRNYALPPHLAARANGSGWAANNDDNASVSSTATYSTASAVTLTRGDGTAARIVQTRGGVASTPPKSILKGQDSKFAKIPAGSDKRGAGVNSKAKVEEEPDFVVESDSDDD